MNDLLKDELDRARKRFNDQTKALAATEETIKYAQAHGLHALAADAAVKAKRQRDVLTDTQAVLADLEKATGALPLEPQKSTPKGR